MRSRHARVLLVLVSVVAACASRENRSRPVQQPLVATFTGVADAAAGTVAIWGGGDPVGATAFGLASLQELPVVQDGVPGSGPPDTVELVTERAATVLQGCGAVDGFEGGVRLRSFFAGAVLAHAHVEITRITPTGREACNSDAPYETLSDGFGLWDYGTIGRPGTGFDSALRTWRFRLPDQTRFVFEGRIMADLVTADPTPPTTAATPGAGVYPGGQVELVCADAETGCAATYYTTDGTQPTTSSPVYSGPIPLTSSFTLRYFSVDYWGNAEAVHSAAYTLDATPPSVVSVSPAAGSIGVPATTAVTVTFSEPVDPASVTPSSFSLTGPSGAVAGTITAAAGDTGFTFTPAAALVPEARYVVAVSAEVHDLAGNALSPAFASDFYTPTSRQVIQPATSATVQSHQLVYDYSGNALAAWAAVTQGGTAIVFATYSASSRTWSAAQVLATQRGSTLSPRVATNGSQFLVAWDASSAVRTVVVQGGAAGAITDLTTGAVDSLAVGASGTSFLVASADYSTVSAWRWNGTWSAAASIGSGTRPVLAGSTVYYLGSDNVSVMASTYGSSWSTPATVASTGSGQGSPVALSVATGSSTVLAYSTNVGHVWATIGSGTSFNTPSDVSGTSSESAAPLALAAAAYGSEYAVAWVTAGGVARGAFRNGSTWPSTPPVIVASGAAGVALSGYSYGFVAALRVYDAGSSISSLWAVPSAGSYGSRTWASAVLTESGAEVAAEPGVVATGTSAMIHWTQAQADVHQVLLRPCTDGALGATQAPFPSALVPGSPTDVRLAANAAGEVLAVWTQDDRGSSSIFASLHRASGWSAAARVLTRAWMPDVASNGAGFLVVGVAASTTTPSAKAVVAVPVTDGVLGPAEVLATSTTTSTAVGQPRVASDGEGYAAIWLRGVAVQAAIWSSSTWQATVGLGAGYYPRIAGRRGEYLFLWGDSAGQSLGQRRASGSGSSWSWDAATWPGYYPSEEQVVAGADGFLVAYRATGAIRAWKVVAGATGPTLNLGSGQKPCDELRLRASGSRYLVAWNCSDKLQSAETDGATASAAVIHASSWNPLTPTALGMATAGDGRGGFRLVFSRAWAQFDPVNLYAETSTAGAWGNFVTLDDRDQPTHSSVALQWDGGAYLAAWTQTTATSPIVDDLITYWGF